MKTMAGLKIRLLMSLCCCDHRRIDLRNLQGPLMLRLRNHRFLKSKRFQKASSLKARKKIERKDSVSLCV